MNCPLTISVSLQRGSVILGAPNQQNQRRPLMEQALQYAMRSQSASCPPTTASYSKAVISSRPCQKRGLVKKVEPSFIGKSDAYECNESLLSNCRELLALKEGRDDFRKTALPACSFLPILHQCLT